MTTAPADHIVTIYCYKFRTYTEHRSSCGMVARVQRSRNSASIVYDMGAYDAARTQRWPDSITKCHSCVRTMEKVAP